jgi:AsmA protein
VKIAKWVAGVLIGLLLLIVLGVVTLTLFIDPNRFRGQIEAAVRDATGRPFQIRGDLEISWFPWLAVHTGRAELGNPPGVSGPPLAQWESARVGVRLLPLIHGQLVIDRIRFEGLKAALQRGADGRANWDDLLAGGGDQRRPKRPAPRIAGVEIRDGTLDYVDAKAGSHLRLSDWSLDVGAWGNDQPVPVQTHLLLEKIPADGSRPPSVDLRFETQLRLAEKRDRLELSATEMAGQIRGPSLPADGVPFATKVSKLNVVFEPLDISIPEWSVKVAEAQLAGTLAARKTSDRLRASGPLSVHIPSVRNFVTALGIDAPLPRDASAMGALSLKTSWAFVDGALALKPIALRLDETAFEGELVRSGSDQPTWTFNLHGDRIDLGRYLITEDKSKEPFELPVETLKALRAQGTLLFDRARLADAEMKNARLRVLMADGRVQASSASRAQGKTR